MGRRRCLGENFGKAILFIFVANIIANYEVLLDTSNDSIVQNRKRRAPIEKETCAEVNKDQYDIDQIHDLGFTLSPKPFNMTFKKRAI